MIKKQIPNLVTLSNLLCGCVSIYCTTQEAYFWAGICILLGGLFDFFDGMVARLLNVQSELGKQLDSLSDMVTFGVAPGFIAMYLLKQSLPFEYVEYVALLIPLLSAYRLAKFNIDSRQASSFIGLPTPAYAIIWASLAMLFNHSPIQSIALINTSTCGFTNLLLHNWVFLILLILPFAFIMISELPLFALKFKTFKWHDNQLRYGFIGISLLLFCLLGIVSIPCIIIIYIVLSIINNLLKK